jgi:hypothetical protein
MVSGRHPDRGPAAVAASVPPFDGWYRFPAAMRADALEQAAAAAKIPVGGSVVDPFCGTGRTATFVTARGERFVGIEAHPILADLSQTKVSCPDDPTELRDRAQFLTRTRGRASARPRQADVLEACFDAEQLNLLVAMRDAAADDERWGAHLRWAVLGAVRELAGGGWPYGGARSTARRDRDPCAVVERRIRRMADDLARAPRRRDAVVVGGDAREASAWAAVEPGSVDASVSSPPYLNQLSYGEMVRAEAYFLGLAGNWRELNGLAAGLMSSCTQQLSRARRDAAAVQLDSLPGVSAAASPMITRLAKARSERSRGKPYDQLLPTYLADISRVLAHLYKALAPGGRVAWVIGDSAPYGIYVDTPMLVGVVATEVGFEVFSDDVLRLRGSRWKVEGRHDRPLTERLLTLRKPDFCAQTMLPGFE